MLIHAHFFINIITILIGELALDNGRRVAWAITGSGDDVERILDTMIEANGKFFGVEVRVYLSKAADQVFLMYGLMEKLRASFDKVRVEKSPNNPFLAGELQIGKFDFLLIAPATSNTTAKIALGLGDSLISNAVNMAVKVGVPVYVLPCELGEGTTETTLPDGRVLKLIIRDVDSNHIKSLKKMRGIDVLESPLEILNVFEDHYST
jgi:archaeoflavoprotein AfpA